MATLQYTWNLSYACRAKPVTVYAINIESSSGAQLG